MKLAFVMNHWAMNRPTDPEHLFDNPRGLTGSEISFIMFAKNLSELGHEVSLFSNFTKHITIDDCEFVPFEQVYTRCKEHWDAALAWIDPAPLQLFDEKVNKIYNQQVNDFNYCQGWENYVDIITSPSQNHKDYLSQFSSFPKEKWKVLSNGCDPTVYYEGKRNHNLVFASSPDRGLHWALELFPEIRKNVPDAELHIYYNFESFYQTVKYRDDETAFRLRYCKYVIEKLKGKGVVHHQSVSKNEMSEILSTSKMMIYPCDPVSYTEGYSCSSLEAAASGCVPVLVGSDALHQIYGEHVPMVLPPYKEKKKEYLDMIINLFESETLYKSTQEKCKQLGKVYDWKKLTVDLLIPILRKK